MTLKSMRNAADRRLTSWKEIGTYFDRDERTVKRWERSRGLPVRRIPGSGRGSVFAYESELAAWLNGEGFSEAAVAEPEPPPEAVLVSPMPPEPVPAPVEVPPVVASPGRRTLLYGIVGIAAACLVIPVVALFRPVTGATRREGTRDPATVALYRAGLHAWQTRTPEGLARAVADFNQAIARDPGYAEAYAGLADCYNLLREFTMMPPEEAYPKAREAAAKAVALDPSLSGAHASLGFVDFYWLRDVADARHEFDLAVALDPANAVAHHWNATFLMTLGEFDRALAEIDKAEALDSESKAILADKGLILFHAGQTGASLALLRQLEEEDPAFVSPHRYLATLYAVTGDDENYLRELHESAALLKDDAGIDIAAAGWAGLHAGGPAQMRRNILDRQHALFDQGKLPAYDLADTYAALDDPANALAWLETSFTRREANNVAIKIDPFLRRLRDTGQLDRFILRAGLMASL